jgi:dipeptidyl-peptidase-3
MATVSEGNLDLSQYTISTNTTINFLDCQTAFDGLTEQEKLYAHYMLRASWEGSLICLLQTSPEAPRIFQLFQKVFSMEEVTEVKERALKADNGLSVEEFEVSLSYINRIITYFTNVSLHILI